MFANRRNYSVMLFMVVVLVTMLVMPLLFISCASLGGPTDSPELVAKKSYMAARKEFALTLQKYNTYYDAASDSTKAKWKENIDPLFKAADKGLDGWKLAIDMDMDPASQEQAYLRLKSELLIMLVEVFGVKED